MSILNSEEILTSIILLRPFFLEGTTTQKIYQQHIIFHFYIPVTHCSFTFFINCISTYSLEGCRFAHLIFGPLLGGSGGTSTTSGDGKGTSTAFGEDSTSITSGEDSTSITSGEDTTSITSSSLQKKTKTSVNILYTSVQCNTQKSNNLS